MICALQGFLFGPSKRALFLQNLLALLLEHVGASFKEQYSKNVLLELRRIHLTAKDVGGREQVAFKFFES